MVSVRNGEEYEIVMELFMGNTADIKIGISERHVAHLQTCRNGGFSPDG